MLPTIQNPRLTAFRPRSIMLSNQAMNNLNKKPSKTLNPCQKKTLLHNSILHYLQRSGFSKTLKYFQREAQIENNNGNSCSLDLEEMYYKSLETRDDASTNWNNCKEQDLQKSDKKDGEDNSVAVVEAVSKKKKKRSDGSNIKAVVNESGTSNKFCNAKNSEETLTKDVVPPLNVKSKEKKSKKISDPLDEGTEQVSSEISKEPVDGTVSEPQLDESSKKGKNKKKKKSMKVSQPLVDNAEPHQLDTQPGENEENPKGLAASEGRGTTDSEANIKSKDKKKKKLDKEKSKRTDMKVSNSQTFEEDALDEDDKVSKKRKRLAYEENNSQPVDKVVVEESKRQKTEGSEESDGVKQLEVKESLGSDPVNGEKGKVALNKSQETPIKQLDVQANGNLDKNGKKSTEQKKVKNQQNSTEPKTVNAFQRVKIDQVEFADERLQDNSYWAKSGADSGYGAKAQEVLGQVRGKDFRHEKTKKKRGSYRGGQIDLQTHSIKFNYSDDE